MKIKKKEKREKKTSSKLAKKSLGKRKNVGLTKSLMIRIVLLVFAALMLLGSIENEIARRISQERITDLSTQAANDYAKLVESELSTVQAYMFSMSYNPSLNEANSVEDLSALRDTYQTQFGVGDIFFVNADGTVFDTPNLNVSDRAYFSGALTQGYYISSPMQSEISDGHVIFVSAPIYNGNWNGGVIVLELNLDILANVVSDMSIAGSGEGYIFDANGTLVASKNRELVEAEVNYIALAEVDSTYQIYADAIKETLANDSGTYEQGKNTGAYKAIEGTDGWKIAVEGSKSELNALYTAAGASSAVVLLVAIIISVVLTLRIVRSVVKPTNTVIERIGSLREGDLSQYEIPDLHYKEMNVLGNSLSETIDNLRNYVGEISDTLSNISENNLDVEITQEYVGDFAEIKNSLIGITDSLNATIRRIDAVSRDVLAASEQVSSSSQLLAQGATEQAGTLEELVTEIEGVSKKIAETAVVAVDANGKTEEVKTEIVKSNEKMQELSSAMADIDETSRQVAKVVKMIEDIAFQTNILALNAAVEAARAGQSGKGFAVVANEVKNLANKSADAAGDTTKLITNTIEAVKKGMDISGETAEILAGVVSSVDDVAKIVSDISVASNEESGAISRVVEGLDQVSVVVQSNSATAEESSALSAELETNAKKLQDLVAEFQLKDEE